MRPLFFRCSRVPISTTLTCYTSQGDRVGIPATLAAGVIGCLATV